MWKDTSQAGGEEQQWRPHWGLGAIRAAPQCPLPSPFGLSVPMIVRCGWILPFPEAAHVCVFKKIMKTRVNSGHLNYLTD